jgi:2-dehydro-3-deoxygalactonokinase
MIENFLLGCDWGTSSFRLRLIDIKNHQVLGETVSDNGISNTYNAWRSDMESKAVGRMGFFKAYLIQQISLIATQSGLSLAGIPLVISGMASSSIGMEDLAYAALPFATDGSACKFKSYPAEPNFPHRLILVSGVKGEEDVMRGEETELIGLVALLNTKNTKQPNSILIFPGTHSKHLYIQEGQLINFQTFMTGEVFNLMATSSVLKNSVANNMPEPGESGLHAFKLGVRKSLVSNMLNSLFSVRTNQLFEIFDREQNYFYLSGLMIGAELKVLCEQDGWQLILCSGSHLFGLYKIAMEELGLSERTSDIPSDLIDRSAIEGQIKIYESLNHLI